MKQPKTSMLVLATLLTALPLAGAAAAEAPKAPAKEKTMEKPAEAKEVTTATGLKYVDAKVGEGEEAKAGQTVSVHYTGWLTNGTKFDSSVDRKQPFNFKLGAGQVIQGWDQGVAGMKVGGKRKLTIPPGLGYGGQNVGGGLIPPNSTLIFDVELLEIKK